MARACSATACRRSAPTASRCCFFTRRIFPARLSKSNRPEPMVYTISTGFAIYFVIWWIALFLTLPFGVRSQHEDGEGAPGTDPGAPVATRMGRKLIWTTIISAVIFAIAMWAYYQGYFNIERLSKLMGMPF